ncbi:MAG: DNA repair protein RadC [Bacteroidales bacterium]|nr:DNA repair protein RadC [Bacteroidales bacterium]
MKLKDLCEDDRPREKLVAKGPSALSNAELLAIMLRTGTGKMNVVDVARELLKSAEGRLNAIAGMSMEKLCSIDGIGPGKAVTIAAAFELGRRSSSEQIIHDRNAVSSPKDVFRMMLPIMRGLDHEECWAVFLNRANYVLGKERMSAGGMDSTVIDTKAVIRRALERKACGVILVHNHPSGSAMPGQADIRQTAVLKKALQACEIQLLDHVVVAEDSWYSFADAQLVSEKF